MGDSFEGKEDKVIELLIDTEREFTRANIDGNKNRIVGRERGMVDSHEELTLQCMREGIGGKKRRMEREKERRDGGRTK